VQPAPHPWTVSIDRAVVHHALAALAAEALEAMPHGGTLTFRTMNVEVGTRRPHTPVGARPGRYVRVEVSYLTSDLPAPSNQQRRDTDEAGVAAIEALRRAGGRVMVHTDGYQVASVVLLLPSDGVTVLRPHSTATPRQSGHTVVLVEGDPTHRRLLQAVLRGQGHDVETANTAEEADRLTADRPDLVLVTDRLPGASAADAAAWVTARPSLRILGTSDDVARALALVTDPRQALSISRPLAAAQITEAVKALFDGEVTLDATNDGADVLAPLWFKRDGDQPIHPLEAS
jgi:CheY-like chemotaxis protein